MGAVDIAGSGGVHLVGGVSGEINENKIKLFFHINNLLILRTYLYILRTFNAEIKYEIALEINNSLRCLFVKFSLCANKLHKVTFL